MAPRVWPYVSLVAIASACGGPAARGTLSSGTPGGATGADEPAPTESADAGALRVCTREAKDPLPCAEDCDRGIASSCAVLATRTEHGEGVPRDLTRAVTLHERACELKDSASCMVAARMHASGAGVPPSRAKQLDLLAHACLLGDPLACALPARAFASGAGVLRDEQRARELWQRACGGGVESACTALGDAGL